MPSYVMLKLRRLISALESHLGATGPSLGQEPDRVDSAAGVGLLQQADRTKNRPMLKAFHNAVEDLAERILELMWWGYDTPRQLLHGHEVVVVSRENLPMDARIVIEQDSLVAQTRQQRVAAIREQVELGLINPADPLHRKSIYEQLDYGSGDRQFNPEVEFWEAAERENVLLMQGIPVDINPSIDHDETHLLSHTVAMNSAEYGALPIPAKANFVLHAELHRANIRQAQVVRFAEIQAATPAAEPESADTSSARQKATSA